MDWDSWTLTQPSLWSSVLSSTWWSVERELSWSHQSPLQTVQDSMEPLLTLLTVECSGSVRMARLTDTIVLQAWPMTRWPGAASGLTRCQSVPHLLWLWMRREESSSVHQEPQQVPSPSTLTQLTADNTSSVWMVNPENWDVQWERCSVLAQAMVLMASAPVLMRCQSAETTMVMMSFQRSPPSPLKGPGPAATLWGTPTASPGPQSRLKMIFPETPSERRPDQLPQHSRPLLMLPAPATDSVPAEADPPDHRSDQSQDLRPDLSQWESQSPPCHPDSASSPLQWSQSRLRDLLLPGYKCSLRNHSQLYHLRTPPQLQGLPQQPDLPSTLSSPPLPPECLPPHHPPQLPPSPLPHPPQRSSMFLMMEVSHPQPLPSLAPMERNTIITTTIMMMRRRELPPQTTPARVTPGDNHDTSNMVLNLSNLTQTFYFNQYCTIKSSLVDTYSSC